MSVTMASLPRQVEPGRLELGIAIERGHPLVAPKTRLLEATEGHRDVGGIERVDPDHAGPDGPRETMRSVEVPGPDPGGEPVRRVVRDGQGVRLVLELGD